jgi:hypothetical protein
LAVLSNTAAWNLLFAVVYKNPGPFVYLTGAVIAVLLLLVGLVLPRTALVLAGLWASPPSRLPSPASLPDGGPPHV